MEFKNVLEQRYATKKFDGKKIPDEKIERLKDYIQLAATSFGLQPFKVMIITNQETKDELFKESWNQTQINTCSHLLVFCAYTDVDARIDGYEKMLKDSGVPEEKYSVYIGMMRNWAKGASQDNLKSWSQKQCYLGLANAINGAKDLGFDSCPMEGFDKEAYAKILELPENLIPTVICPVGYADDIPKPKIRFKKEELFF